MHTFMAGFSHFSKMTSGLSSMKLVNEDNKTEAFTLPAGVKTGHKHLFSSK